VRIEPLAVEHIRGQVFRITVYAANPNRDLRRCKRVSFGGHQNFTPGCSLHGQSTTGQSMEGLNPVPDNSRRQTAIASEPSALSYSGGAISVNKWTQSIIRSPSGEPFERLQQAYGAFSWVLLHNGSRALFASLMVHWRGPDRQDEWNRQPIRYQVEL